MITEQRLQTSTCQEDLRYETRVVSTDVDREWDSFLKQLSSGSHVQTSHWARVKALHGWQVKRVVLRQNGRIAAGAQLLLRKIPVVGQVGYVPKGPVCRPAAPGLAAPVIETLKQVAADQKVKAIFVQPPDAHLVHSLTAAEFLPSSIETSPSATVMVDLTPDLDSILASMTKGMRNGIRRSERRGVNVRDASEHDLPIFHRLLTSTSKRLGFSPFPLDYFVRMWGILEPDIGLFISEYQGEPVSAQLVIPFGDTLVAKQIGWSGRHGHRKPNEALDWATIKWAKARGYRYYDLEGIEREAAAAILRGDPLPPSLIETPTAYKLRLGNDVRLLPGAYCYIPNPVLRAAYRTAGYRITSWPLFLNAVSRFRTS